MDEKETYAQYMADDASTEEVNDTIHSLSQLGFVSYFKPIIDERGFGLAFFHKVEELIKEAMYSRKSIGQVVIEYEANNTNKDEKWIRNKMQRYPSR